MLNPIQYLECRLEWLRDCLAMTHNSEDIMHLAMKIENLEYELSRAYVA